MVAAEAAWVGLDLLPPMVPSLDFGLAVCFRGEASLSFWGSSIGDLGVGDFVRARPPSVPSRLRGEGAADVDGWGV